MLCNLHIYKRQWHNLLHVTERTIWGHGSLIECSPSMDEATVLLHKWDMVVYFWNPDFISSMLLPIKPVSVGELSTGIRRIIFKVMFYLC